MSTLSPPLLHESSLRWPDLGGGGPLMWRWTVFLTAVLLVACAANTPPGASDTHVAVPGIARDSSGATATTQPVGPGAPANDGTCGSATPTTGQFEGTTFTDTFDGAPS